MTVYNYYKSLPIMEGKVEFKNKHSMHGVYIKNHRNAVEGSAHTLYFFLIRTDWRTNIAVYRGSALPKKIFIILSPQRCKFWETFHQNMGQAMICETNILKRDWDKTKSHGDFCLETETRPRVSPISGVKRTVKLQQQYIKQTKPRKFTKHFGQSETLSLPADCWCCLQFL